MTTVTLADACTRLPELIGMVAGGEQVVIVQNGMTVAALTPPPFVLRTPEEEAERQRRAEAFVRELQQWRKDDEGALPAGRLPGPHKPESPAA